MNRLGRMVFGEYRAPSPRDVYRSCVMNFWLYRKLFYGWFGADYLRESRIRQYFLRVGEMYFANLTIFLYISELVSFTAAVYLVNTGNLFCGIVVGVLGILVTNRVSSQKLSIESILLASSQIESFDSMKQRDKGRDRSIYE